MRFAVAEVDDARVAENDSALVRRLAERSLIMSAAVRDRGG
jgi:hypothetical protein